jgi:hypothetical protein
MCGTFSLATSTNFSSFSIISSHQSTNNENLEKRKEESDKHTKEADVSTKVDESQDRNEQDEDEESDDDVFTCMYRLSTFFNVFFEFIHYGEFSHPNITYSVIVQSFA